MAERFFISLAAFSALLLVFPAAVPAQTKFPEKAITLICPYPPGGSSDLISRSVAQVSKKYISKPMVVVNRDGANGVVATTESVRTAPDGYTILQGSSGLFTTIPLSQTVGYKQEDFEFLVGATNEPTVLTVNASSPFRTIDEWVKSAKEKGTIIRYSNSGLGSIPQLSAAYFFRLAGVKSQPIPFKGGGPAVTSILGGHVDMAAVLPGEILPHVKAGKLRPLIIAANKRFPDYPDMPTMKERGFDIDIGVKKFIFAPRGLPGDVRKYLVDNLTKTVQDEEFKKAMIQMAIMWEPLTAKELVDYFHSQQPIMKDLIDEMNKEKKN
jgi:tripartite-type tricarboxylate transporter receptor subunit TctC